MSFNVLSCQPEPNLLQPILSHGGHILRREGLHLPHPRNDIDVLRPPGKRRPITDLVSHVQHHKNGQGNVRRQEIAHIPLTREKHGEPVGEGQHDEHEQDEIGRVRLERCLVGQGVPQILELHRFAEAEVGDDADHPRDEAADGGDVDEPVEDDLARFADRQERQQAHGPGRQDGHVRHAEFARAGEHFRRLAVERQTVEDTRARVQEGVARGPGRGQDGGVDDVVQHRDLGDANADDPRTGGRVGLGGQQAGIRGGADGADHEGAKAVEDGKTPDEAPCGLGDVASRGDGLARRQGDELWGRDKCEASLDKGGPESEEVARLPADQVLLDRAVLLPVPEPGGVVVWCAAAHDDETDKNQTDDGDELDAREPELGLTKDLDGEDVESEVDAQNDGDPYSSGHGRGPVIQNDGTRRGLGGDKNGVGVPVVPACGKGKTGLDESLDKVGDRGAF